MFVSATSTVTTGTNVSYVIATLNKTFKPKSQNAEYFTVDEGGFYTVLTVNYIAEGY